MLNFWSIPYGNNHNFRVNDASCQVTLLNFSISCFCIHDGNQTICIWKLRRLLHNGSTRNVHLVFFENLFYQSNSLKYSFRIFALHLNSFSLQLMCLFYRCLELRLLDSTSSLGLESRKMVLILVIARGKRYFIFRRFKSGKSFMSKLY